MRKRILILVSLAIICVVIIITSFYKKEKTFLPTYFSYTDAEILKLKDLDSDFEMNKNDVYLLDEKILYLLGENTFSNSKSADFLAYFAVAQRDAAYLSYNLNQRFKGNLGPVSKAVVRVFMPESCESINIQSDEYSEQLSEIVIAKVKARIEEDRQTRKPAEHKEGDRYWKWTGDKYIDGKTWLIESADQFDVPKYFEPGSEEEKEQIQMVKQAVLNITDEQRMAALRWAGGLGTKTVPGHWFYIFDMYMEKDERINLEDMLFKRSILQMIVGDASLALNHWKYTYLEKRPFQRLKEDDPALTIFPTPNAPSYPSNSMTIATAASNILTYYFPENKDTWENIVIEIGNSRIWGGIHFPRDIEQGRILGEKAASEVIRGLEE